MKDYKNYPDIPPEGLETPDGYLYYPPSQGKQILFLIGSFFSAIILGLLISNIPGDLSELATGVIYFTFILVFISGYSAWAGRVSLILFGSIKLPVMKAFYRFFIHKEKPGSLKDLLPTKEETIKLMTRVQKSTKMFFIISFPVGMAGGFAATFIKTSFGSASLALLIMITAILYGYILFYFGRRGYLPLPEE